jgi:hypothetical protein
MRGGLHNRNGKFEEVLETVALQGALCGVSVLLTLVFSGGLYSAARRFTQFAVPVLTPPYALCSSGVELRVRNSGFRARSTASGSTPRRHVPTACRVSITDTGGSRSFGQSELE